MNDEGGEAACWAHLASSGDDDAGAAGVVAVDLTRVDRRGASGVVWHLPHGGDLDANLVALAPGDAIGDHVNGDVDVLVVVERGEGMLSVDDRGCELRPGVVVLVPVGHRRKIAAGAEGLAYLSVHRRRGGIALAGPPSPS